MVKVDRTCVGCKDLTKTTKRDARHKLYLCETCAESEEYKLEYKSHIKDKYFINPIKLEGLPTITHYIHRQDATLYKLSDILDVFCAEYNVNRGSKFLIEAELESLKNKKAEKKAKREEDRVKKLEKMYSSPKYIKAQEECALFHHNRKVKLIEALKKYGLELRSDSKLCQQYIDGVNELSIDEIVERMCEMKYLFDYCNMKHYLDYVHTHKHKFKYSDLFTEAEILALGDKDYCEDGKWPWLKNN
jgi:ribosomal protein L13E